MAGGWFESVAVARRRAERTLPASVAAALRAGAEAGVTLRDNEAAFSELGFAPTVAGKPGGRDLSTSVMGQPVSMPVLISPTGVQAVHPEAEVAVAGAAAARGTVMCLSAFGSKPIEEVVAANPRTLFQIYWCGSRDRILQRLERARSAGAVGLIVTLDWSFVHSRDWGSPFIPQRINLEAMRRLAPEVLRRPRWLCRWLRAGRLPDLTVPNMAIPGEASPGFFDAYGEWMQTPPPSWDDLAWLRQQWDGPCMIKGIVRVDDARRATDIGATAISVSNHGGNNLDTTPATIRLLQPIAAAVGNDVEVLLDGGIRRGGDVVKAVALGARAVLIGRACLWGLAANGRAGVENVLDVLRAGIDSALLGLGRDSIADLTPHDILIPPGFSITTGTSE
ncbi:MAG: mycofactocin biosynthesis FMN-dependent deaminase MftD [Acidimicrobiia bacterium]|nr:mycofactocin biosynthesis FMN-dependent deaminase MftD [Acidimicrobiia bacterium]MYC45959.1 mycofactocin biosynthesis FMN-dependent deaminase MftD [Acidimicrobiia bacterium]